MFSKTGLFALLLTICVSANAGMGNLYDRDLKANWDVLWRGGVEGAWGHPSTRNEIQLGYHKINVMTTARGNAVKMINQWGWDATSEVVIVFCGFGWIVEALAEQGVTSVTCIEDSAFIQSFKLQNADADISVAVTDVGLRTNEDDGLTLFNALRDGGNPRSARSADLNDETLDTRESRDVIADQFTGNNIHVVTYDGWLQTLDDAEVLTLSDRLNRIQGVRQVSHMVFFGDAWTDGIQDKTQIEWEVLVPADEFVQF